MKAVHRKGQKSTGKKSTGEKSSGQKSTGQNSMGSTVAARHTVAKASTFEDAMTTKRSVDAKRSALWRKMIMQAVGPSGGSTVKCNTGEGVPMGDTADGEVMGADGCAPISARRTSRSFVLLVGRRAHCAGLCLRLLCSTRSPATPIDREAAERVACVRAASTGRSRWAAAASWRWDRAEAPPSSATRAMACRWTVRATAW